AALVRVIGGPGDDTFEFCAPDRRVRLYDSEGANRSVGEDAAPIDATNFDEWAWSEDDRDQPRDWGRRVLPVFWSSYALDIGPFIGGGAVLHSYGFRKLPFAGSYDLRAGLAPQLGKWRLDVDARTHTENSPFFWTAQARVSRLDVIHYYGVGNDATSRGRSFHRVDQTAASLRLGLGLSPRPGWDLSGGVAIARLSTDEGAGRFFGTLGPVYGGGEFHELSGIAAMQLDPLAESERTANRFRLHLRGTLFPALLDTERTYGKVAASVSVLFASSPSPSIALALRAGGEQIWGRFPWHRSAFLGGTGSLSGWDEQRFAGDVALSGGAELRLRVWRPRIVVPVSLGPFGFADAGRVYLDGASPGGWHTSRGGGVWLQPALQPYIVRAGLGASEEATRLFVTFGLPY
ncbi:MAG TPA: hypothetical protein VLA09_07455, partial [Longimicrobiales bacterium]|nr:hypothetical protein [Longimicrobiales bacterium]